MAAPEIVSQAIVDALHEQLGNDTVTYCKSKHLARDVDVSPARVAKALEALNGDEVDATGITVSQWSRSAGSGQGYTWEIRRTENP